MKSYETHTICSTFCALSLGIYISTIKNAVLDIGGKNVSQRGQNVVKLGIEMPITQKVCILEQKYFQNRVLRPRKPYRTSLGEI